MVERPAFISMRNLFIIILTSVVLMSCTSVIRKDLMESGIRSVSFETIRSNPDLFEGKIFILGGIVVKTRATNEASIIEAIYVPVDRYGKLLDIELASNRFLAVVPKGRGFLDPLIYRKGREITIAGVFVATEEGLIDEMEYVYPVFDIRELYLWDEAEYYYMAPPYQYWNDPYYYGRYGPPYYPWYDPWWYRPYYPPRPIPYDHRPKR